MTSCADSTKLLEVETIEHAVTRQIYERPLLAEPPKVTVSILTASVAQELNKKVFSGDIKPYAFMCYTEKDYLSFAKWLETLLAYIAKLNVVIDTYEQEVNLHNEGF